MSAALNRLFENGHVNNNDHFTYLSESLARFGQQDGLPIIPYYNEDLPFFSALSAQRQRHVLWQLQTMVGIAETLSAEKAKINSSPSFTRAFLTNMGYRVPDKFWAILTDQDVVDIYSDDHILMFASLKFFEYLSYSLEDFYCRPWMELFGRDLVTNEKLFSLAMEMIDGRHDDVVPTDYIPLHVMVEMASDKKQRFIVQPRMYAPLYKDQERMGYVCVNRAILL